MYLSSLNKVHYYLLLLLNIGKNALQFTYLPFKLVGAMLEWKWMFLVVTDTPLELIES